MMKSCKCPVCDSTLNAASDSSGSQIAPNPDDYSVCLSCASPLRFNAELMLEYSPVADIDDSDLRDLMTEMVAQINQHRILH
jgi:hypothetical protein